MVLENFKSYAGPREIGPFHKSFTSVVGPNGSGKSNVIDAMLFVFGFKAKKMRQGKLSELIHHSATFPDLESASVSVHFVDIIDIPGDDFKVIPGTEYVVMRNVTKSGKSQYYVNDKPSNFTEVTDALKKRGIDLDHKRFLILQGEVESISQMKPKAQNEHEDGLLEYLEDIIGTSGYKQPIEEAGKKVEELNEQRGEKLNRVKIVEKEKDSLEGKKAEAMEFLVQENELTQERSKLYQIYVAEATENVTVAEKNMQAGKAKLAAHAESSASLMAENTEMEKEYRQISKDHEDLAKVTKEAKSEFGASEREYIKLQENHKHIKEKIKKQKKANEKDSVASREQNNAIQNCKADLEKLGKELEKLTKSLAVEEKEYETIRDSLKGETQVFQVEIEKKQTDLAPWLEKKAKIQAAIDVAQSELELLTKKAHSTENALKDLKEKQTTAKSSLVEKKKALEAMQKERAEISKATDKSKKSLEQLKAKEPEVTTTVKICREKLDEAKSSLQSVSNRGKVLSGLLKQRDSGRIRGIYGRLGDLGTIKDKYDVAISTACPALDNIVVDTTETGQQCIEYLRKNQLGRSTFIVLDKLNTSTPTPETPESAPRLFDLVKAKEEKFLPAFYNALRDTLVANDLEQANRIAFGKQRFRVVTLDGKLIDKSGTMSGGGNRVVKGGMSSVAVVDVKPEDIQVMEKESEARGLELKQIQEQQKALIAEIEALTQRLSTCDTELAKCEMDVNSLEQQLIGFQSQEKDLKSKGASVDDKDIQRMKQLEGEVSEKNKEMDKLSKSTQAIEDAIKVLQNKIMEVGGIKLKTQKSKLDGIKESIENANDKTTRLQVQMKTSEKSVAKVNTQLAQAEQEIKEMEVQLQDLEAKIEEKTTIAAAVHEKCEQAEKLMEKKQDELEKMKGSFEKIQKKVQKLQAIEVGIKSEIDTETRGFEENKKKLAQWTAKLNALKVQDLKHLGEQTEELKVFSKEEIREMDKEKIQSSIVILEEKLKEAKPNLSVIEQFLQLEKDYLGRVEELDEITKQRDASKGQFDDLRKKRLEEFMEGFSQITQKLKEMYQMITLGGNAELELVDSLDPFSEGIIFSVMPPKKSWKNIANLSGGEKTLSSLALVFALHHYKPTPLYVMDEIDAALDFRNVSIVANYIKERTKNAQFVIISLRNNMFELADRLVGIYKTDSCTKSITIDPREISVVAQ